MDRRSFVETTGASLGAVSARGWRRASWLQVPEFPLEGRSVEELRQLLADRRTTAQRLVEQYTARITWLDDTGPQLGHVLEVNPDARAIAAQLDGELRAHRARGPLHGIPVLIKDNIATADHMQTTAGSLALVDARPPRDAFVARKLREAGAVILGKTNLSEWANYRSTHSVSGWSGRGGQCRNPNALDRTPSGSSSGSAAAAAASSCAVAIGTETNGSIVSPSSACGCVGIKPTVGLVSRSGIIPISHSQDTAGPIARTVADAAVLLAALAGSDPDDAATAEANQHAADYTRALDPDGLRGARLGVMRPTFGGPKVDTLYAAALAVLAAQGAVLVDPVSFPPGGLQGSGDVLSYEFKADVERYLADWAPTAPVRTLADLIAFNQREAAVEMPYFAQELFEQSQARGPLTTPEYIAGRDRVQRAAREAIDGLCDANHLDAIVSITGGPARPIDLVSGDAGGGGSSTYPAVAGYPHVTVPMGYVFGLPVGISFFGKAWTEATLIKLAFAYEQATRLRHAPALAPTADVPWDGKAQ